MIIRYRTEKALKRRKIILFSAFFFFPLFLSAQIDFTENCLMAYQNILSLDFQQAEKDLAAEKLNHPGNPVPAYLENYMDFLNVFIREEEPLYASYKKEKEIRMKILGKSDPKSPFYLYLIGNIHLQSAIVKSKFGDYTSAALEFDKAYRSFTANKKLYPGFLPDEAGLGLVHVLAGVVPDSYSWILSLLSMQGDIPGGLAEISRVAEYSGADPFTRICRMEALFYLSFLDATLGRAGEKALSTLRLFEGQNGSFPGVNNPLFVYVRVSILSKAHHNDEVIRILDRYQSSPQNYRFCYLDYMTGLAKLYAMDPSADRYFIRFLKDFRGKNYIKSAYQKLAWYYLIQGDPNRYGEYIKMAHDRGSQSIDGDKQAKREAETGEVPNVPLLKARLLFDGGYFDQVLRELLDHNLKEIVKTNRDLLEYHYRLGRTYQETGDDTRALSYFDKTIREGKTLPYYFAANAALQSGMICEKNRDYKKAEEFYRLCMGMDQVEYKTSLDQKAKAGLQRIKKARN